MENLLSEENNVRIWKLKFEVDRFDNIISKQKMDIDEIQSFKGSSKINSWIPKTVIRMEPEKKLSLSNAPGFYPHLPVFDRSALDVLLPLIKDSVEVLPLIFSEKELFAINIVRILDCIDREKSDCVMFPDMKRIARFKKYSFYEEKVGGENLFKIKEEPLGWSFVSDTFRNCVQSHNLTGFKFELVWDSEHFD